MNHALFIDDLILGEYNQAFWRLLLSPLKAFSTFLRLILIPIEGGWKAGFLEVITPSFKKTMTFFSDVWETEPLFFFAVFMPDFSDSFEGPFFGRLLRKLTLLLLPAKFFELYRNQQDSPHSPSNTVGLNEAFKCVVQHHAEYVDQHSEQIHEEISVFLKARQEKASSEDERFLANAALRCLIRFKDENETALLTRAMDLSKDAPKSALYALYLIWREVTSVEDGSALSKQERIASYLGQIQRGQINHEVPDHQLPDSPECPTGAISILFLALDRRQTVTLTDSSAIMQTLLNERLQQGYNTHKNYLESISEYFSSPNVDSFNREQFINQSKPAIKFYARFLNETDQGRKISGLSALNDEEVEAITDATLDAWNPTAVAL